MNGKETDKKRNITKQVILKDVELYTEEFKAGMIQLRRHYSAYEITELYELAKELDVAEQQILADAGFFTEEFRAGLIELRQHYSLDEIIELYRLAGEVKATGGDPVRVLRDSFTF